jgi:hypothetical protein
MTKTLAKMAKYLEEHGPNEHRNGRKTAHIVPDIINQGQAKIFSTDSAGQEDGSEDEDDLGLGLDVTVEPEDLLVD